MLQLKNETPFKTAFAKFPNKDGVDTLYLVVTATFNLEPRLELAEEQLSPILSDEYVDQPGRSSLRCSGELHIGKPATDVIVAGYARAPGGKPITTLQVGVRVGRQDKMLSVTGDRHWLGMEPSKPAPFTELPLIYELAFGGELRVDGAVVETDDRNPLGVGLGISRMRAKIRDPLPNIEDPRQPLREGANCVPAGFGCIPGAWLPRRSLVGTYDENWQRTRAPYLPQDFKPEFLNSAAEGLTFRPHLKGGEPLLLVGMSERGPIRSAIPTCLLETAFMLRGELHRTACHLQTVFIEPDSKRLRLTFHTEFVCDKLALEVERIHLKLERLDVTVSASS
ncbi:MAG TPA: DUF2169 domain-containing protein [Polyangiales bacterium]|nr:DUF2169 domain-containing protein [Polyangiales bacterium]